VLWGPRPARAYMVQGAGLYLPHAGAMFFWSPEYRVTTQVPACRCSATDQVKQAEGQMKKLSPADKFGDLKPQTNPSQAHRVVAGYAGRAYEEFNRKRCEN